MRNQMRRHVFMPLLMGGVLVASLGFIVGCGPTQPGVSTATSTPTGQSRVCAAPTSPGGIPQFTITTPDTFTFAQPPCVQAGLVDVTLVNGSPIIRQAAIVRLKESVTYDQVRTALSQQGAAALAAMTIPAGGPSIADQGLSTEVILNLVPGQYATIDPFIGPDGTPHYIHGALSPFTVTTPTTTLPEPRADGEIVLKDFLYMLGSIKAGSRIIKVTNAGAQDHELTWASYFHIRLLMM